MKQSLFVILVIACLVAACGGSSQEAAKPNIASTPTPEPHQKVGTTVQRDGFAVTLVSAKTIDPASIPQHEQIFPDMKSDQTFLVLDEQVKNITTKDQSFAGMQLVLQDAAGHQNFSVQIGVPGVDGTGVGGPIAPNMQQRGAEAYIVPKDTHLFYLLYEPKEGSQVIWDIHV